MSWMVKLLRDSSFKKHLKAFQVQLTCFLENKSHIFLLSPYFQGISGTSWGRGAFKKFHCNYFVKTEVIMLAFFHLSCSYVKEAVFCCMCLIQWSWELNSDLLNSDDDAMEKFILPMLPILQSEGTGSQMVSCSRAPNVTGEIDG